MLRPVDAINAFVDCAMLCHSGLYCALSALQIPATDPDAHLLALCGQDMDGHMVPWMPGRADSERVGVCLPIGASKMRQSQSL